MIFNEIDIYIETILPVFENSGPQVKIQNDRNVIFPQSPCPQEVKAH